LFVVAWQKIFSSIAIAMKQLKNSLNFSDQEKKKKKLYAGSISIKKLFW